MCWINTFSCHDWAIVLTHRKRDNVRKQDAVKQTMRDKSESIEINKVEIGKGAK